MDPISVLVVDDEPGIALLCKRMLTRAGYEATALTDPREAVEWLEHNRAALLLVDIRMSELDGFEVLSHASRLQPEIAVLVMTGLGTSRWFFYQRLCQAGKAKKLELTACMRKLLVILNAMLKHRTPWQPHEVQHA